MGVVKNSLIALGVLAIATLTSVTASASLLIEPHLGYNVYGNADYRTALIKYNGPQYGARLGGQVLGFMAGLDYTHSTFTYKTTTPTFSGGEDEKKRDQIGVFVGYNLPLLFRAWFGYYFSDKVTQTKDGTYRSNGDWDKGHGTEIGVGFTGLPFLSLNLQYRMSTYDTKNTGTLNPSADTKEIVLGVSAPFTLL
ncbi:MAG: hypothetical protein ACXVLQ_13310 [Bacteriovorax sp.]